MWQLMDNVHFQQGRYWYNNKKCEVEHSFSQISLISYDKNVSHAYLANKLFKAYNPF